MSNAIIKQQGDFPLVADNVWHINAGAGTLLLGLLAGAAGAAVVTRVRSQDGVPRPPTPRDWPIAFIHRGGADVVPEDTIQGFTEGLRYGDGVLECDVHSTLDGELVVMHDDTVDRTTDGTGPIRLMSLAEVKRLDAGYRFTSDGGATYSWRGRGVTVPTLAEVYETFPDRYVNIEIKSGRPDIEQRVAAAIEHAGAQSRTIVVARSRATIRRFRAASQHRVATGAALPELLGYWLLSVGRLHGLLRPRFQALQPPEKVKSIPVVTRGFVRAAHGQDLRVDVWTIDEAADMRRLLSYGVDGIMTDRPDLLAAILTGAPATASRA